MRRRLPFRHQVELADCGAAALAVVLDHFGAFVPLDELRVATATSRDGTTAAAIVRAARIYGLDASGVKTELDTLQRLPPGTILYWSLNHFVVLERTGRSGVMIVDPAFGRRRVSWEEASAEYSGVALTLTPGPEFKPTTRSRPSTVRRYFAALGSQRRPLRQIVTLSLVLRAIALALPLLTKVVIDAVLPMQSRSLLVPFAAVIAVVFLTTFAGTWLRSSLLLEVRSDVDLTTTVSLLDHLVSLPLGFLQRRRVGDLAGRLRSNSQLRELLTTSGISALLDGAFAITYLVLLLWTARLLGIVALVIGAFQVGAVLASQRRVHALAADAMRAQARSQTHTYQMLAGMTTLKASGTEGRAVEEFRRRFADELRTTIRRGRVSAVLDAVIASVSVGGPLVLLGITAGQILDGRLGLGAGLSANALAMGFLVPAASLATTLGSLTLARSHIERLDDILEAVPEQHGKTVRPAPALRGNIATEGISFRYSPVGPFVLQDVDLELEAGKSLAVVGASGSGKTTLGYVLIGLYEPTAGRVLLDGEDLAELQLSTVRPQLGVVTQDPYLFSVSIRENIAFGRPDATYEDVRTAARVAQIDEGIMTLPMGYGTVLSEGGAPLSGGQRQRVALARALCSRPRILLLDEATSHLDVLTERRVHDALDSLGCTRIVIAHRLSTVVAADEIVVLEGGRIVERGPHSQLIRRRGGVYAKLARGQSRPRLAAPSSGRRG